MPRQVLTVLTGNRTAGQQVTFSAVTVADGAEFTMPATAFKPLILVKNGGAAAANLMIQFGKQVDGVAPTPRNISIPNTPAGAVFAVGAYGDEYKQTNGKVNIDVSAGLDVAIVNPGAV